jgi:hypothetical protein
MSVSPLPTPLYVKEYVTVVLWCTLLSACPKDVLFLRNSPTNMTRAILVLYLPKYIPAEFPKLFCILRGGSYLGPVRIFSEISPNRN